MRDQCITSTDKSRKGGGRGRVCDLKVENRQSFPKVLVYMFIILLMYIILLLQLTDECVKIKAYIIQRIVK